MSTRRSSSNNELQVSGLDELQLFLSEFTTRMAPRIRAVFREIGEHFCERARANAPILHGPLREGIGFSISGKDPVEMQVYDNVPYAFRMHEGIYDLGPISRIQPDTPEGGVGPKYFQRVLDFHISLYQQMLNSIPSTNRKTE